MDDLTRPWFRNKLWFNITEEKPNCSEFFFLKKRIFFCERAEIQTGNPLCWFTAVSVFAMGSWFLAFFTKLACKFPLESLCRQEASGGLTLVWLRQGVSRCLCWLVFSTMTTAFRSFSAAKGPWEKTSRHYIPVKLTIQTWRLFIFPHGLVPPWF